MHLSSSTYFALTLSMNKVIIIFDVKKKWPRSKVNLYLKVIILYNYNKICHQNVANAEHIEYIINWVH